MSFTALPPVAPEPGPGPQQPLAAHHDQHHQEQANPEGPVLGGDARDHVVHQLEHHGPRDASIQPAHAADHEDQHQVRRPLQGEHVERGKAGGLCQQGTGCAGHTGGHGVGHRQPRGHRNADGHRAQPVVAHGHQRGAERRMHQAPRQQEDHQQHGERVPRRRLAHQVEFKAAQQGSHGHPLQAVGTTGQPVQLVGQFQQQQGHAQRDHEPGQVRPAHDGERADCAQRRRCHDADRQAHQRIGHHMLGKQRRRIGPETEKGRVAQRHDAGVAQDEVQ
jgi:hypothetical protein